MVLVSLWNFLCMYLLFCAGVQTGEFSLGRLSMQVSPILALACEGSLLITQFSFCVTYFLFFLDCFAVAVQWFMHCAGPDLQSPMYSAVILLCLVAVLIPLCSIRRLDKLAKAALFADVLLLGCIAYVLADETRELLNHNAANDTTWFVGSAVGQSLGTSIFAFEGIGMVLPVAGCMQEPQDFRKVLLMVGLVLTTLYVTFGFMGAAVFGDGTRTTILLNLGDLNPSSPLPSVLQLGWCASILVTFPIQLMPATTGIERVFVCSAAGGTLMRAGVVCFLGLLAYGVRDSFSTFLALSGVFCCLPLAFIYPPILHWCVCANTRKAKLVDILLLSLGVGVCKKLPENNQNTFTNNRFLHLSRTRPLPALLQNLTTFRVVASSVVDTGMGEAREPRKKAISRL